MHNMRLIEDEFNNIKYKGKVIEVRINDEKRRCIGEGDKIIFHKLPDMKESILVNVEKVYVFHRFEEVYGKFPISYFGYEGISTKDLLDKIYAIYSKEEEKNLGVVAIKFNIDKSNLTN